MFIPKQGDIVWVDFDPTRGRETQKRRPALVISSDKYNCKTKFAIVLPITSTLRTEAVYYTLEKYKTVGQVITFQMRSVDLLHGNRNMEYIESMYPHDFLQIAQMIEGYFEFSKYMGRERII